MGKRRNGTVYPHRLTTLAIMVSAAMVLSYLEHLIPVFISVPGVKLGLANIATVFALYSLGWHEACAVSFVRVMLSALLFGNLPSLIYSLWGAALSLAVMILLYYLAPFSSVGVSVAGGVTHNAGQLCAAALVMNTPALVSYFPVLLISGTLAGVVIGLGAGLLIKRLRAFVR